MKDFKAPGRLQEMNHHVQYTVFITHSRNASPIGMKIEPGEAQKAVCSWQNLLTV